MKRIGNLIQYGVLGTLLVFGSIIYWGTPSFKTFLSVIILGVVLGLLFLIYNIQKYSFYEKFTAHIVLSALAIFAVSIFNMWLVIKWDLVFTWLLIIGGLVLLAYFGYQYYIKNKDKIKFNQKAEAEPNNLHSAIIDPDAEDHVEHDSIVEKELEEEGVILDSEADHVVIKPSSNTQVDVVEPEKADAVEEVEETEDAPTTPHKHEVAEPVTTDLVEQGQAQEVEPAEVPTQPAPPQNQDDSDDVIPDLDTDLTADIQRIQNQLSDN